MKKLNFHDLRNEKLCLDRHIDDVRKQIISSFNI